VRDAATSGDIARLEMWLPAGTKGLLGRKCGRLNKDDHVM